MEGNSLVTVLLIVICIQVVLIALLASRPPQIKVVEVEIEKKLQPPPKQRATGPVDVEVELAKLVRKVERRYGLVDNFRSIYHVADLRRVIWWHDEESGRIMFQFEDVLEYEQVQAEADQFELEQAERLGELDTPPALLPEEKEDELLELSFDA